MCRLRYPTRARTACLAFTRPWRARLLPPARPVTEATQSALLIVHFERLVEADVGYCIAWRRSGLGAAASDAAEIAQLRQRTARVSNFTNAEARHSDA